MNRIRVLRNRIQNYAWGSHTAIPELLGVEPDPHTPWAELWMGAHPKAPSEANVDGHWRPLDRLIAEDPQGILGKRCAAEFNGRLPYLFKVLAAARPLSLQAHPSFEQAREGFRRENLLGIPLDAPERNYRDGNHKPECVCALGPFWAMCGFRKISDIQEYASRLGIESFKRLAKMLDPPSGGGSLKAFFRSLMTLDPDARENMTREASEKAERLSRQDPVFRWMTDLADAYPGDIGIFSPILLNLIRLNPGEAMFLPAGELHAYLEGSAIELMANSDNVLRGGLTPKHVDVEELMRVLNFREREVEVHNPPADRRGERVYRGEAKEFVLSSISLAGGHTYESSENKFAEILFC